MTLRPVRLRYAWVVVGVLLVGSLAAPPATDAGPTCTYASQATCAQATGPEAPPPPPPPPGPCSFQVNMKDVRVAAGQGISEGNLEVSVVASAGAPSIRWPASGQQLIAPGTTRVADRLVASHTVDPGQHKVIDVCAVVTELDRGGLNGRSDIGAGCRRVDLVCPAAPAPVPALEFPARAPLCEGNRRRKDGTCKRFNGEVEVTFRVSLADEDGDGVANDVDMTPRPEDEACRGQRGRAVILYSEFGDSDLNELLGVAGLRVDDAVQGYDWVGIVMDPLKAGGFLLRASTLALADMVEAPTLDGLLATMRAAVSRGFDVSVIVQAHGGADPAGVAFITSADAGGAIDENQIRASLADPEVSGTCRVPIRMVHSLAGYGNEFGDAWLESGAIVSAGPKLVGFYPQEAMAFVGNWNLGNIFRDSVQASVDLATRASNESAVESVGAAFGCVPPADSVLGLNACAEGFFTINGPGSMSFASNGRADYDAAQSGRDNMQAGSEVAIQGDDTIDKFQLLSWP